MDPALWASYYVGISCAASWVPWRLL